MNDSAVDLAVQTEELASLVWGKLLAWVTGLVEMLPNIAVACVVLVAAAIASRVAAKLVRSTASHAAGNEQVVSLLAVLTRFAVAALGVFVALGILQLDKTVTSLLAGIGVVGLALGFAFQDIAQNFMSGVIMALREPFRLGDLVETHGTMGHVERVTLRATVLRNFDGQLVMIPNKDVLQNAITNFTRTGARRVDVAVGVSYADDLEQAAEAARKAVEGLADRDDERPIDVFYTGFGASSIDMSVRFWIDLRDDAASFLGARSRAIVAIKRAFDDADLTIPFPIRTLDFGIEGGQPLEAALVRARAGGDG